MELCREKVEKLRYEKGWELKVSKKEGPTKLYKWMKLGLGRV
ncbi:hypothetical protein ES703_56361 [subsurface metagenome]